MRIVVDTNVLLSAALRDRLPEKVVQHIATAADCDWIATPEIIKEYVEVLRRPKFALSASVLHSWAELIAIRVLVIPSPTAVDVRLPRDPNDAPFLAAAIIAGANYLITGDNDLLHAKLSLTTRIVTVAEFAATFGIS
jgi:putative PIN family toxin of toxin-antitoxin system